MFLEGYIAKGAAWSCYRSVTGMRITFAVLNLLMAWVIYTRKTGLGSVQITWPLTLCRFTVQRCLRELKVVRKSTKLFTGDQISFYRDLDPVKFRMCWYCFAGGTRQSGWYGGRTKISGHNTTQSNHTFLEFASSVQFKRKNGKNGWTDQT